MNGTIDCPRCGGSGRIMTGLELRRMRWKAGLTLLKLAKKLDFSQSYLSDIEIGKRCVTRAIEELYRKHAGDQAER